MISCSNADRVAKLEAGLAEYLDDIWTQDDRICAVIDVLTDLRHFCEAHRINLSECSKISLSHYEYESLNNSTKEIKPPHQSMKQSRCKEG